MELLKSCLEDWIYFSLIEGFLYIGFAKYVLKYSKLKVVKDGFIISILNCLISQVFPPLVYQVIMILWMGTYFYLIKLDKDFVKCVKISFKIMLWQLIVEMLFSMILEKITLIDFSICNKLNLFFIMILVRLIEILTIYGCVKMKGWLGGVKRK